MNKVDLIFAELTSTYTQLCRCHECQLPAGYYPQLRPPGPKYDYGGVVFMQINPGHIGSLSDVQIAQRYRTDYARQIAKNKASVTHELVARQNDFLSSHSRVSYELMRDTYLRAMSEVWGWPSGKYGRIVESHGGHLESVAMVNLAQCPVPNDAYSRKQLERCFSQWTSRLLDILQPSFIVAQGTRVFNFLCNHQLLPGAVLVEGIHHADRSSRERKEQVILAARAILGGKT